MKICAIHQPNFFPWSGYFDKIRRSDVFIFLDEVAYPKSGSGSGSWCNRVKLLNAGTPTWYGLPINKCSGVQLIKDVTFSNKSHHLKKLKKTIAHNYKKADHFKDVMEYLEPILDYETDYLAEYNINAIQQISQLLGIQTQLIKQSELQHTKHSTALLVELVKEVNADAYLCGNGASGYQEDALFQEHQIELIYQNYHPTKDKHIQFKSETDGGLSILNYLFNYGINS